MRRLVSVFAFALLACAGASAQTNTVPASFFGSSTNMISPNGNPTQPHPWCPQTLTQGQAVFNSNRLWDDGVKWDQVELSAASPTDTTGYSFAKLDWVLGTSVDANPACTMPSIYVFGATPEFAAAGTPSGCTDPGPSGCAPPNDLNYDGTGADAWWLNYVGQLAIRYSGGANTKGHIKYWSLWNEADANNFWCKATGAICGGQTGSLKNLVLMAWDMKNLTRCIDPTSRVVSLDGHVNSMTGSGYFHQFDITSINAPARNITITPPAGATYSGKTCSWSAQTVTGTQTFDIVDEHMRGQGETSLDPSLVINAWQAAQSVMNTDSLNSYPLWNDEWGYTQNSVPANVASAAAYFGAEIVLMVSFNSPAIAQENFYQWDKGSFPPSQSIVGDANNILAGWFIGATVNLYTNVGNVYSVTGTLATGGSFLAMFDKTGTCSGTTISTCGAVSNQSAGSFTKYTTLDGVQHNVSGGVVPVGLAPILLTGGGGGNLPANTPTFNPVAGNYGSSAPQNIAISTTSNGAILCYTTDGSSPSTNGTTGCAHGTLYSTPVAVSVDLTLSAVAGGTGYTDSTVGTAAYSFQAPSPTLSPTPGTYQGAQSVTITTIAGVGACYTTDGSQPASNGSGTCTNGTLYSGPVTVSASETLKAISIKSGWLDGSTVTGIYTIQYTFSVIEVGLGSVTSAPTGISCGSTCSAIFNQGTSVTLTATAGSGYSFTSWSGGGCAGNGTCVVTVNSTTSVTATFTLNPVGAVAAGRSIGVMLQ